MCELNTIQNGLGTYSRWWAGSKNQWTSKFAYFVISSWPTRDCNWTVEDISIGIVWSDSSLYNFEKFEKSQGSRCQPSWLNCFAFHIVWYLTKYQEKNGQAQGSTVVQRQKLFWSRPLSLDTCGLLKQIKIFSIFIPILDQSYLLMLHWLTSLALAPQCSCFDAAQLLSANLDFCINLQILIEPNSDHQLTDHRSQEKIFSPGCQLILTWLPSTWLPSTWLPSNTIHDVISTPLPTRLSLLGARQSERTTCFLLSSTDGCQVHSAFSARSF